MKAIGRAIWLLFSVVTIAVSVLCLFVFLEILPISESLFYLSIFLLIIFLPVGEIGMVITAFGMQKNKARLITFVDGLLSIVFVVIMVTPIVPFLRYILGDIIGYCLILIVKGILGLSCAFVFKRLNLNWIPMLIFSFLILIGSFIFFVLLFVNNNKGDAVTFYAYRHCFLVLHHLCGGLKARKLLVK